MTAPGTAPAPDTSWHEKYVEAYRKCRTNAGAAREAGVHIDLARRHVKRYPEFATRIAEMNKEPMPSSWTGDAAPAETHGTDWAPRYLESLRLCGSPRTAAKMADIQYGKVSKRLKTDTRFAEQVDEAKEAHLDDLEADLTTLGRKGNFLAIVARLRAGRPEKYLEKAQVQQVIAVNSGGSAPSPDEVAALLRNMLASARPSTLEALAVKPDLSLPAPADSQ